MHLPCVVYNGTGPIQVRWYHSQNGNSADAEELNIIAGGRYTVEEPEGSNSRYENCTEGDQLYQNALKFIYSEGDSGSYWCRIVIGGDTSLELSEAWKVDSMTSGPGTCGPDSQTDPKCAGQIIPTLVSTALLIQSTPTSVVGATFKSVNTVTHAWSSPDTQPSPDSSCLQYYLYSTLSHNWLHTGWSFLFCVPRSLTWSSYPDSGAPSGCCHCAGSHLSKNTKEEKER